MYLLCCTDVHEQSEQNMELATHLKKMHRFASFRDQFGYVIVKVQCALHLSPPWIAKKFKGKKKRGLHSFHELMSMII